MKTALIIGGSSGMALDAGKRLGERGVAVTITGRDATKLERAALTLKKAGAPQVNTKAVDLYDRAQVDAFAREVASAPAYNYLVNSAGFFSPTPFFKQTREIFHQYLDLNESFFFLTQAVAKRMADQKVKGSIVNVGSMWARQAIKATPSSSNNWRMRPRCPKAQLPLSSPLLLMTRCAGTLLQRGDSFMIQPTTRAARGRPSAAAIQP